MSSFIAKKLGDSSALPETKTMGQTTTSGGSRRIMGNRGPPLGHVLQHLTDVRPVVVEPVVTLNSGAIEILSPPVRACPN